MRTSRLSKETARVADALRAPRRQTRASLARAAPALPEDGGDGGGDIEDAIGMSSARKRKRDLDGKVPPPATAHTVRSSRRKPGVKTEDEDEVAEDREGEGEKLGARGGERRRQQRRSVKEEKEDFETGTEGDGRVEVKEQGQRARRARRQPARREVGPDGSVTVQPPAKWEEMYELTAAMRRLNPAPVDTMGCESLAEPGVSERDWRFQTLVALMLSSQTKDTVTAAAIRRLQAEPGGLTLAAVLAVDQDRLNELIWQVGFHNTKARHIKRVAEVLRDDFGGDIPDTAEGLMGLPGVGPKMAYLCMSSAWGRDEGIGVDVHVHRITNLWGWHATRTPEETRAALEAWLPRDRWHDINHLLVGFGQTICAPVGRRCAECTLSDRGLCPSAVVDRKVRVKKPKRDDKSASAEGAAVAKAGRRDIKLEEEDLTVDGSTTLTEAVVKEENHTET